MVKTICHFKDDNGPVAIRTDNIISIEGDTDEAGNKVTLICVDRSGENGGSSEYTVLNSVMDCISEWDRCLKSQNS